VAQPHVHAFPTEIGEERDEAWCHRRNDRRVR
jgi:hypothetical protein